MNFFEGLEMNLFTETFFREKIFLESQKQICIINLSLLYFLSVLGYNK